MMHAFHSVLLISASALCLAPAGVAQVDQDGSRQLRRDSAEVVRKAERLRDLMQRLLVRYKKEGRDKHVATIQQALKHMQDSGLLEDVAEIRSALDAQALAKANAKQKQVLSELEKLLAILMNRNTLESLEKEIKTAERMAQNAAALEQRQADLQKDTRAIAKGDPTDAEKRLAEQLDKLAKMQRDEARQNQREAGTRMPVLEQALARLQQLLRQQDHLENSIRKETDRARKNEPDPAQQQAFQIGDLKQRAEQQQADAAKARNLARLDEALRRFQAAQQQADANAKAESKDELLAAMQRNAERNQGQVGAELRRLLRQARGDNADGSNPDKQAASKATPPKAMAEVTKDLDKLLRKAASESQKASEKALEKLTEDAAKAAKDLAKAQAQRNGKQNANAKASTQKPPTSGSAQRMQQAAKALRQAKTASQDAKQARAKQAEAKTPAEKKALNEAEKEAQRDVIANLSKAVQKMQQARASQAKENPNARQRAAQMAAQTAELAEMLRQAQPTQGDGKPEEKAANKLDAAEKELRKASNKLRPDNNEDDGQRQDRQQQAQDSAERSRQNLQAAKAQLDQAMQQEQKNSGRGEQSAARAQQRQEQINKATKQMQQQLRDAEAKNQLAPEQRKAAEQRLQKAQAEMKKAQASLQNNRQATAAERQQDAAKQLDAARRDMQKARPMSPEQQREMKDLAKKQKELADDIMRLAKLAEERKNQQAKQALDKAADAAKRAQQEMEQGKDDAADAEQQEAKEQLQKAQEQLEEERDRYVDLRQEELLFKIKEELTQFLAKQKPLTEKTKAAAEILAKRNRLPRRTRRSMNDLGELETELAGKARFMREALEKEQVLVFSHALRSTEEDLNEVARRLAGRQPDPGDVTVVLQQDVERRTEELIKALKREQDRRKEAQRDRQQQEQQQQQQDKKQQNQQQQQRRLVSIIAELQMLMQMEQDIQRRTEFMGKLIRNRGDAVSEVDLALLERLGHRHNRITKIFAQLRQQIENAINPPKKAGEENDNNEEGK